MMNKTKKRFDSVEMMRTLRDAISGEIEGMSYEEERKWLDSQKLEDPFLEGLRRRAGRAQSTSQE